jgi:hypothetical protein
VVVVAQGWPCWLSTVLTLNVPLEVVYVSPAFCKHFLLFEVEIPWRGLDDWTDLFTWPAEWESHTILAAGSSTFVHTFLTKLNSHHMGVLLYATDVIFRGQQMCDILGQ